jgi:hypothetical protein
MGRPLRNQPLSIIEPLSAARLARVIYILAGMCMAGESGMMLMVFQSEIRSLV